MAQMTKIVTEIRKAIKENVGIDISRDDVQNLVSVLRNIDMIKNDENGQKNKKLKSEKKKITLIKEQSITNNTNAQSVAGEPTKSLVESLSYFDIKSVDSKQTSQKPKNNFLTKLIQKLPNKFDGQERYLSQCFSLVLKIDLYLLNHRKQDVLTPNYQEILDSFEVFLLCLHKGFLHENKHWKPIESETK